MSEKTSLDIVLEALERLSKQSGPMFFYIGRRQYCVLWANENGWTYRLRLFWRWGRWPRTFRAMMRMSGADRLKVPANAAPHWRFAADTMTLD